MKINSLQIPLLTHELPGRLVAVCGVDGAGKTSAINSFETLLDIDPERILHLRQPSDWWRSDPSVNSTLLLEGDAPIVDEVALGVFGVADRINQQIQVIEPALSAGKLVLMDRYVHCLIAYFLAKNDPYLEYMMNICEPLYKPDLTIVVDCPPDVAISRVIARDGSKPDRFDQKLEWMSNYVEAYRLLAKNNDLRIVSSLTSATEVSESLVKTIVQELRECAVV